MTRPVVKDTPHSTNCFSVLENCTVGSTKDMLDSNVLPMTEEVVSKSETSKPAHTLSETEKRISELLQERVFRRSTYNVPIQVHTVDSNRPLAMKALIDCGATAEFINHEFVRAHEIQTYLVPHPIGLYNADGLPNEIGKITKAINLVVQYKGHRSQSKFYISSIGNKVIVLGHAWLAEHNPDINWCTGKVKMTCCPDYCGCTETNTSHPEGITSSQLVSEHGTPQKGYT